MGRDISIPAPEDRDLSRAFRYLTRVLYRITQLPVGVLGPLDHYFRPQTIQKGVFFQYEGEMSHHIAFVAAGLFRMYYQLEDGREFCTNFCRSGHFLGNYGVFIRGRPSSVNIQALENSRVLLLPFDTIRELIDQSPAWTHFGRRLAENLFIEKEDRERELLLLTAEERYLIFHRSLRRMEERIAHYHIASYLGITPVALSRIRGRLRESGTLQD